MNKLLRLAEILDRRGFYHYSERLVQIAEEAQGNLTSAHLQDVVGKIHMVKMALSPIAKKAAEVWQKAEDSRVAAAYQAYVPLVHKFYESLDGLEKGLGDATIDVNDLSKELQAIKAAYDELTHNEFMRHVANDPAIGAAEEIKTLVALVSDLLHSNTAAAAPAPAAQKEKTPEQSAPKADEQSIMRRIQTTINQKLGRNAVPVNGHVGDKATYQVVEYAWGARAGRDYKNYQQLLHIVTTEEPTATSKPA